MEKSTRFIGMDVHKDTIVVAVTAIGDVGKATPYGTFPNTAAALEKLVKRLRQADNGPLKFCYEAGPCGYGVHRTLTKLGEDCMVVAPSMIPRKSGDRQKNDKRDAASLAVLLRGGLLTAVWVPNAAHEAMRELIRTRLAAVRAVRTARQQLSAFLLRHERIYPNGRKTWTKSHRRWLADQNFSQPAQQIVLEESIEAVRVGEQRRDRIDDYLRAQIPNWSLFPLVRNLCALRGLDMIAGAGLAGFCCSLRHARTRSGRRRGMTRRRQAVPGTAGSVLQRPAVHRRGDPVGGPMYLMFPISYRDLALMLLDRGVEVDHSTIFRWIQAYAVELEKRLRPHLRMSNGSWRVDETYVKVKGRWLYLYRAVDSRGQTIDFLLSVKRDAEAAKRFFRKALAQPHTVNPRTITVDKNAADPKATAEMKKDGELWRRSRLRQVKYLNNIVEQDHRRVKRLTGPGLGFGGFWTARRTLAGYEAMAMIRKGQARNIGGSDIRAQAEFIAGLFRVGA